MDIDGLGDKLVEQMVDVGLVTDYADLYRLKQEQVSGLERMAEKSSTKLIDGIQASKTRGLAQLLNALSIRHVGARVAAILADNFATMDDLQQATVEQMAEIHEVGDTIAQSVHNFLHGEHGSRAIEQLRQVGVAMQSVKKPAGSQTERLAGKTLVVTGTLTHYTREEIHELIREHGGRHASSVSKKTDFLVAGEKAGSKLDKARKLEIPVLSEDDFRSLIEQASEPL
jgi:DNA ligase (NAD+)